MLTNTQLLERYLYAIESWLPKEERRDILAELSEDLHSEIEDQQAALGRPLTEAEFEAMLKQRGRPMLVANRYRPQQSLIGPTWFPSYVAVLKMTGIWYLPAWVAVFIAVDRLQHPDDSWATTMMSAWTTGWTVAFVAVSVITLIFALVQLIDTRTHFMESWNPRELPAVRNPCKIPRANSVAEILVGILFVLWWVSEASTLVIFKGPAFRLVLAPAWFSYFWGCLAICLLNLGLSSANFIRPHWTSLRASLRMVSDFAAGALFCWLMKTHIVAELVIANTTPARTAEIRGVIQLVMERSMPFAVIVVAVVATYDLFRVVRVNRGEAKPFSRGAVA